MTGATSEPGAEPGAGAGAEPGGGLGLVVSTARSWPTMGLTHRSAAASHEPCERRAEFELVRLGVWSAAAAESTMLAGPHSGTAAPN